MFHGGRNATYRDILKVILVSMSSLVKTEVSYRACRANSDRALRANSLQWPRDRSSSLLAR